jgi:predicted membrane GTPase involved in stress response
VLLVDVSEGPMAQTKYVLSKALTMGLKPLVVFNKIDRPGATVHRCDQVHTELFDLFGSLGADDEQLDFPVIYASGAALITTSSSSSISRQLVTRLHTQARMAGRPLSILTAKQWIWRHFWTLSSIECRLQRWTQLACRECWSP